MQFITGHAHMNRHQNLMDSTAAAGTDDDVEVTSPRCRFCDKGKETPYHLVLECEEIAQDQNRYLRDQPPHRNRLNDKFNWTPHKLCQFVSNPTFNPLFGMQDKNENTEDMDTSVDRPENAPLPSSGDEDDRDGDDNVTMKDIWNRPLNRKL